MSENYQQKWLTWVSDAESSTEYAAENLKLDFALALERRMEQMNVSRADLARALGTSPAAITKTLSGDANLSIERMVRLVHALNASLHVHIAPVASRVRWFEVHTSNPSDQINYAQVWAKHSARESNEQPTTPFAA